MNETTFANIDLEIESEQDITPLAESWREDLIVFRLEKEGGIWFGSFETSEGSVKDIVEKYYQLVSGLTTELRDIWGCASKKTFDIGFNAGHMPHMYQFNLPQEEVSKLSQIGGSIAISIYAPHT